MHIYIYIHTHTHTYTHTHTQDAENVCLRHFRWLSNQSHNVRGHAGGEKRTFATCAVCPCSLHAFHVHACEPPWSFSGSTSRYLRVASMCHSSLSFRSLLSEGTESGRSVRLPTLEKRIKSSSPIVSWCLEDVVLSEGLENICTDANSC